MLAALLTVLLLTQTLCITAFAENPVEVLIPQGSETNAILTAALIPDATETQSWEYKCEGTSKIFTKNTAWGSVNGFESSTKKLGITTTYTMPHSLPTLTDSIRSALRVRPRSIPSRRRPS